MFASPPGMDKAPHLRSRGFDELRAGQPSVSLHTARRHLLEMLELFWKSALVSAACQPRSRRAKLLVTIC